MRRWENALQEFLLVKSDEFNEEKRMELAYYMGLCYTKLERDDEALPRLEQVVIYGENFLRAYQCRMTLAYIYIITGKAEMAEAELNRLQKSGFESAPLYNTLAYSAYMQKRFHDAVELYEKALDLERDNATALNSMGFILADTGMDREKGLKLCRKAVEHRPKSATYLDSLGWAHYKNGNFSEARSWLSRAMDIARKEKEIKEHFRTVTGGRL
jgi:tetratricopeptide (TPR) repeat protein